MRPAVWPQSRSDPTVAAHAHRAHEFFTEYGKKAVFLARFLPIVRTFVPIIAGVAQMPYRTFMSYNVIGGGVWVCALLLLGYFFGSAIPHAEKYLYPIVVLIIIVSFLPVLFEMKKRRKHPH